MRSRWPLLALLCVLTSIHVPGIASANSAASAESCVGVFDLGEHAHVEVEAPSILELRQRGLRGLRLPGADRELRQVHADGGTGPW